MALISETCDDGSNGGDPNKNPQEEEENENENPQEVEENLPIQQELPEELIESILLLVRRCHYPKLSLCSKAFRRVISSSGLYESRLHLGLTEPVLYALIRFPPYSFPNWYILNRNIPRKISLRLSEISSLPPIKPGSAVVTIGYKMYVIGGFNGVNQPVSMVIVIDCRFHTWNYLPNMQRARAYAAAGVIDAKIYVIGGCEKRYDDWIEVFDVENEIWSPVPDSYDYDSSLIGGEFVTYVVMQEKIYILNPHFCLAYEPRQGTWQSWGLESELWLLWHESCCVVEDLLYSIDHWGYFGHPIVVYDPNNMAWKPVKCVSGLPKLNYYQCKMANFGGKLVILGSPYGYKDVWCLEIAIEKRKGGEIWGNVDSVARVLRSMNSPSIELCRSVTF